MTEHTWALQCLLLGVAEYIHHRLTIVIFIDQIQFIYQSHHPSLGVRVHHPEPHTSPAGDDLVGHVAVAADTVPDHGHGHHHPHPSRGELTNGGHHTGSSCCTTFVSRHASHDSSSLPSANWSSGLVGRWLVLTLISAPPVS